MEFNKGSYVWIPDEYQVVVPAEVLAPFATGQAGNVQRVDTGEVLTLSNTENVVAMHVQCLDALDDMVNFKELNEFSILNNLRKRYSSDIIYTNIGKILTSVNPFKKLRIYNKDVMESYLRQGSEAMAPHIYGVADDAFRAMLNSKKSQSCIVSGESGAGKTEATKVFLHYISEKSKRISAGTKAGDEAVEGQILQQKILETNPLMEAFGNAKTVRNDNSSRFGKWIEVQFDNNSGVIKGGCINSYLLEKSRVVFQAKNERNYHIFYQLCSSASNFDLLLPSKYNYLNKGDCKEIESVDDEQEWVATKAAMEKIGISAEEMTTVFRLLAAILNLGNIEFEGDEYKAKVVDGDDYLLRSAQLFGFPPEELERSLVNIYRGNPRDPDLIGDGSLSAAKDARDAMAKYVYASMFDWLISKINESLGKVKSSPKISSIGVLDIFGFEFFEKNSFEQLCINYCNERLQGHFNTHIFKLEQQHYAKEGIDVSKIAFKDNENVILAIDSKGSGILQVIANELKLKTATDVSLLKKIKEVADQQSPKENGDINVITYPSVKEANKDQTLDTVFRVHHYAGVVGYDVEHFLEKNKDSVPVLVQKLCEKSEDSFMKALFKSNSVKDERTSSKSALGLQFSKQLTDLMEQVNATQPHYVRCVKPNEEKNPDNFSSELVLNQLRYAGLLEVCRIRQMGYPVRRNHLEFYRRYQYLVKGVKASDHTSLLKVMEDANIVNRDKYQIGHSKVFLKDDQAQALEEARIFALASYAIDIQRVARGSFARKYLATCKVSTLNIQKVYRGMVARKETKKYNQLKLELENAISKMSVVLIEEALLACNALPYGGKHLKVFQLGKDTIKTIVEEEERKRKEEEERKRIEETKRKQAEEAAKQEADLVGNIQTPASERERNTANLLNEQEERERIRAVIEAEEREKIRAELRAEAIAESKTEVKPTSTTVTVEEINKPRLEKQNSLIRKEESVVRKLIVKGFETLESEDDVENAVLMFEGALQMSTEIQSPLLEAKSYHALASAYMHTAEKVHAGAIFFQMAADKFLEMGENSDFESCIVEASNAFEEAGEQEQSMQALVQAVDKNPTPLLLKLAAKNIRFTSNARCAADSIDNSTPLARRLST